MAKMAGWFYEAFNQLKHHQNHLTISAMHSINLSFND
jgi:hypothetical protein